MARTDTLPHFLTDVADAIRTKKGSSDTIQASTFDTEIANLPSGGDLSEYFNTTITQNGQDSEGRNILYQCVKKLPEITVASNVTSLQAMFRDCFGMVEYPKVICGDNVTNMSNMYNTYYENNNVLQKMDISGLNTSNVTTFGGMFKSVKNIKTLDFSHFNTSKVTTMNTMFYNSDFEELDLSSFNTSSLERVQAMFGWCKKLKFLDVRTFNFSTIAYNSDLFGYNNNVNSRIPADCEIIVKDDTQKTWVTTNYNWLTNVKTVAEYEAE